VWCTTPGVPHLFVAMFVALSSSTGEHVPLTFLRSKRLIKITNIHWIFNKTFRFLELVQRKTPFLCLNVNLLRLCSKCTPWDRKMYPQGHMYPRLGTPVLRVTEAELNRYSELGRDNLIPAPTFQRSFPGSFPSASRSPHASLRFRRETMTYARLPKCHKKQWEKETIQQWEGS